MVSVSVIIPTFNRADKIMRAVESALAQTHQVYEIIVVDDGSTDSTSKVFNYISDSRVKYVSMAHSGLPAVVRNTAMKLAKGDFVAFLDSDDIWLPKKLEIQLSQVKKYPEIGLFCSNAYIDDELNHPMQTFHESNLSQSIWTYENLLEKNIVITSSVLAKKSLLEASGNFPEESLFRAIEDYALWLKVAYSSPIFYSHNPLTIYSDLGNSLRFDVKLEDYWLGMLKLVDYSLSSQNSVRIINPKIIRKVRSRFLKELAIVYYRDKKNINSAVCILKAIMNRF